MYAVTLGGDQDNIGPRTVFIGRSIHVQFPSRNLVILFLGVLGVSGAFRDEVGEGLTLYSCSRMESYFELAQLDGPL